MSESSIAGLIGSWGYASIFTGMFLEGLTMPFPGAIFIVMAGALAIKLNLSLWWIIFFAVSGYLLGALFPYYLAKLGGKKILDKYGRCIFLTPRILNVAEFWFQKHGNWVVCLSRPFFFGNYISYLAGLNRMKLAPFMLYTILGVLPWGSGLVILGYYSGQAGLLLLKAYSGYALILIPVLVIGFFGLKTALLQSQIYAKLKLSILKP